MQATQKRALPETLKVEVLRSFYFHGKPVPARAEIELPYLFAREVIAANKAKIIEEKKPEAAASPPAPETSRARDTKEGGAKSGKLV